MTAQVSYFKGPQVTHDDIVAFAKAKVNLPKAMVDDRRGRLDYLKGRLEYWIGEHSDYNLRKIRGSGSVTKGTALKSSSTRTWSPTSSPPRSAASASRRPSC